jgi:hypothetical protein
LDSESLDSPYVQRVPLRQRRVRRALAPSVAVTITGTVGGLAITGNFGASSSTSSHLSAQVNVDLKGTIATLSSLGFGGREISSSGTSGSSRHTDCAESSTGLVRKFFTQHPCEQYTAETWTITRQGANALVAFSWMKMATASLASQYKVEVDAYGTGNPSGISPAFNGYCYASDQQGLAVWTVEVQPTGKAKTDQGILQDAVKGDLSQDYLQKHCVQ